MEEQVICKLCSAASHLKFNIKGYIQHLRLFHAHQANFRTVCGIHGCVRFFTNFGTFINHAYSVHVESSRAACEVTSENTSALAERHEDENYEDGSSEDEMTTIILNKIMTVTVDKQQKIWTVNHFSLVKCYRNLVQHFC